MPTSTQTPRRASTMPRLARLGQRLGAPAAAVAFVLVAISVRFLLGQGLAGLSVFSIFYPAILGAGLIGGEVSAATALVLSFGASWGFLSEIRQMSRDAVAANLLMFLFTGAFIGAVGSRLRTVLRRRRADFVRLAEREARYRALFEGVSEGFALLEAIWGADGRLADYVIIEANPALLAMFHIDASIFGRRQSELSPATRDPAYMAACERAFRGETCRLEVPGRNERRWFDVLMSPVAKDRIAQLVVDITERKVAESRRVEMFDELNHRVKNNLAAVSAMLSMQARATDQPALREHLQKAVDRIQTIGEVHTSLYRASSTDEVDFAPYLQRLCERLQATLVEGDRVRIEVAADPVMAPLEDAVALGLIVNELVTNAVKYAYPSPGRGLIHVELRDASDGLRLSVSDAGVGLSGNPRPGGIGMRLVRSLVQQCRGELEVNSGPGASFTVRVPHAVAEPGGTGGTDQKPLL